MIAFLSTLFGFLAVPALLWRNFLGPAIRAGGLFREVEPLNNGDCRTMPELEGCEKMVLDHSTDLLYLACSRISARPHWLPSLSHLNASGIATDDYVGVYDIASSKVTRLKVAPYPNSHRGLSLHGMDVVESSSDPNDRFVYLVNHRVPLVGKPEETGADSSVEIFSLNAGTSILNHVATIEDPIINTPNDLVGSPDGKSFWFTNDHKSKTGNLMRHAEFVFDLHSTSVGYCHVQIGCKTAATKLPGANGIVKSPRNNTFYVGSAQSGGIRTFELQRDNTLALKGLISTDSIPVDNLSIDNHEALWAAGFPRGFALLQRLKNMITVAPSRAIRVTLNTDSDGSAGHHQLKSEKYFEDGGDIANGATSVVYHTPTRQLFLNGVSAPALAVCRV